MLSQALTTLLIASLAFRFGGWPWATVAAATAILLRPQLTTPFAYLKAFSISFAWLAAFIYTDDRRLFFPFTIQLAMQSYALHPRPILAATGIVAVFTVIRLAQQATLIVLTVELLVALVALALPAAILKKSHSPIFASTLASLLAFAGLIF